MRNSGRPSRRVRPSRKNANPHEQVEPNLLSKYRAPEKKSVSGPAVVPLRGEICSGCNMNVRPQIINEVLAGEIRACSQCGRLLYDRDRMSELEQNAGSSV